ncbi:MAG: serine/threonine protein kinase, partial [Deltaproteobacteria bacterium]|nr:serine/threonine protein kinase [Deltaproteobacteria bacterium]
MPTIKEMISLQREAHPEAGKVVGGFYALDSSLGSGGFGCVWKAKDRHSKDRGFVAVKFLGGFKAKDESAIASLKNEFAILKDLNHPHINKVYDFGRDSKFGQYIVTELVDGLPLQKAFSDRDADFCEAIIVQILRALAYIHSRGVFHFDIKPPNVVVKDNNHAVLIDFGIAALQPAEKAIGSLSFMAPEMIMHQMPDGRADLYSVGVLFYSILTGGNPFISMSFEEAKEKHLKLNVPPPSKVRPNIPSYFDIIIGKLLSKNPADRYQTASE